MGKHLKRFTNKFTTDNTDIKKLENVCPTILTETDRIALSMVAEGKDEQEIANFLEITPLEVSNIMVKPQVEGILREYYDKILKFKLAPKALKVIEYVMKQNEHTPAKLTAALKVLTAVDVMKKDAGSGHAPNVGVFVNTTITGSKEESVSREQIAIMRNNLVERRIQIHEKSTNTGSGSSNRDGPDR